MCTQFRNVLSLSVLFIALISLGASGGTGKAIPMKIPSFSWTPSQTILEKNEITFAIVAPSYTGVSAKGQEWGRTEPFKSFRQSMVSDMEELLTARGYNIRGPFDKRDEMVYADKEACHLMLTIDVVPKLYKITGDWINGGICEDKSQAFAFKGSWAVAGDIILTAVEPISGEKIWAKKVEIPEGFTPEFRSVKGLCGSKDFLDLLSIDTSVQNQITELLQGSYAGIMDKIWNHLDPSEFARDMQRIKELKKK